MVVKKEILSRQIEEVNSSHSEKHQALVEQSEGTWIQIQELFFRLLMTDSII